MATFSGIYSQSVGHCSLVSKERLCFFYLGPSSGAPTSFWSVWWKSIGKLHCTCEKYETRYTAAKQWGKVVWEPVAWEMIWGWLWRLWIDPIYFSPSVLLPGASPDGQFSLDCKVLLKACYDRRWQESQPLCLAFSHPHPCTLVGGPEYLGLCFLTPVDFGGLPVSSCNNPSTL